MSPDTSSTPARAERGGRTEAGARRAPPSPAPERTDGRGSRPLDGRSVPDLLRELSSEGADLVRQEVALAKAEMNEKIDLFQRNMIAMVIGGTFLLAALLFGLWAVNAGLTALLTLFVDVEVAVWLSPLILAVALAAIGWGMIQKGKQAISREGLTPQRTMDSLEDDKRWARSKAREMKEDMNHG